MNVTMNFEEMEYSKSNEFLPLLRLFSSCCSTIAHII